MLTLLFSIVQQITQEKHISYVFSEFSLPEYKCLEIYTHYGCVRTLVNDHLGLFSERWLI